MSRIQLVDPESAEGKQKELLDGVQKKLGMTPNLLRGLANSPAALQTYLSASTALGEGNLSAQLREQIALAVAESNNCDYCLAAHSAVGKMVGLNQDEIADARQASSSNSVIEAALQFARRIVETRGWVTDADLERVRDAGFGDAEITEIVANVAFHTFTNYFNHIAETPIDFPQVEPLATAGS